MSIFNFDQTSPFLRHYISNLPKRGRGEGRKIAQYLKVSTTLVSQVLSGEKSFTVEQTLQLAEYLGLTGLEAEYLLFLVQNERAGTKKLRDFWRSKLEELREKSLKLSNRVKPKRILDDQEKSIFYSSTIYSAVRMFTSVEDTGKTLAEISERFSISRIKASEVVMFLVDAGLCVEENGRFKLGAQSTHLEFGSHHLLKHLTNWRLKAISRAEELGPNELMYTAPVSLSRKDFELLREQMVVFIKNFLDKVHDSQAEEIACLNMDFFWVKQ